MPVSHLFLSFVVENFVFYSLFESSVTVFFRTRPHLLLSKIIIGSAFTFFLLIIFIQVMLLHCSVVKMLEVKSFSVSNPFQTKTY